MWIEAQPASTPPEDMRLVEVQDAYVTRFERGSLRTERGPARWMRGAVHDRDGRLVPESQRWWHGIRNDPAAADEQRVDVDLAAPGLTGTWLYVGHWSTHFGHFLLETLPNLWPDPARHAVTGLVAHRPARGDVSGPTAEREPLTVSGWQSELVDLSGYGPAEKQVVDTEPVRVERLIVPERPVVLKRWVHPHAVALWRRVSDNVGARGERPLVYFSRTEFHRRVPDRVRTDAEWDHALDRRFADHGFVVVQPEQHSVREQIELVRGAAVMAGLSGSAMHLSAFAEPGCRVLTVGDRKQPAAPGPAQVSVDAACGHRTAFVPYGDATYLDSVLASLDDTSPGRRT